jgi:primosomal protein N' (replication factor Y)
VRGFWARELTDRFEVQYPPYARLALVRVDAPDEQVARSEAARLAAVARTSPEAIGQQVEVLGPSPAPIARLRGRFRFRILLRSKDRGPLRRLLSVLDPMRAKLGARARAVIDVDPVAML